MNVERPLNRAIYWLEAVAAAALVVLTAGAIVALIYEMYIAISSGFRLEPSEFNGLIAVILEIFIIIELFRIALAYMSHKNVIPTVLEAALVAVARKLVVYEAGDTTAFLIKAGALALLLVAVSFSWWLLSKGNACEVQTDADSAKAE